MFHHGRNRGFQGHRCQASSEDALGFELIACVATSCSKQPHTEGQKVRRADSLIDGAVKACVSRESRCCYKCVTDMLNPSRKHLGWFCCSCRDWLTGQTQTGTLLSLVWRASTLICSWYIYKNTLIWHLILDTVDPQLLRCGKSSTACQPVSQQEPRHISDVGQDEITATLQFPKETLTAWWNVHSMSAS